MNKDNIYFEKIDYFTNTFKKNCIGRVPHAPDTYVGQLLYKVYASSERKIQGCPKHSEIALI